jgi:hypothetical protein
MIECMVKKNLFILFLQSSNYCKCVQTWEWHIPFVKSKCLLTKKGVWWKVWTCCISIHSNERKLENILMHEISSVWQRVYGWTLNLIWWTQNFIHTQLTKKFNKFLNYCWVVKCVIPTSKKECKENGFPQISIYFNLL